MDKPIYKSKTIWACAIMIIIALYQMAIVGAIDPQSITQVFVALGIGSLRDAV